jgi:heme-degrading monooxygenase HmoA
MIAVIFEVEPADGCRDTYLDLAAVLRRDLTDFEGFVSIERFESLVTPGKILSLSFWRDEEAVQRWRCHMPHRSTQEKGRNGVFTNYRLRVASVIRDYGMKDREQAPEDSRTFHDIVGSPGNT